MGYVDLCFATGFIKLYRGYIGVLGYILGLYGDYEVYIGVLWG